MSVCSALLVMAVLGADASDVGSTTNSAEANSAEARRAIQRSLPFIEQQGVAWIEERKCVSCHHSAFLLWSHYEARRRGVQIDEKKFAEWTDWSLEKSLSKRDDGALVGSLNLEGLAQLILGQDPTLTTPKQREAFSELHRLIIEGQQADGSWKPNGQLPTQRRPLRETTEVSTMWMALALSSPGSDVPAEKNRAAQESLQRALKWLQSAKKGISAEWFAVRLLLAVKLEDKPAIQQAQADLLAKQNADGGWSWIVGQQSDALATGQSLYALAAAGFKGDQPNVQRACRFLLQTQRDDGSWAVKSTKKSKKDDVIPTSVFWGATWATMGLAATLLE